jgi:AcrR family transcriptional regulator
MTAHVQRARPAADGKAPEASEVKQRILDASIDLFGRKGYAGVSVREICRAADTTGPMVYYYFRNKRGLYQSILTEAANARRRQIERASRSKGEPLLRLRRVLEAWAGVEDDNETDKMRLFFLRELFGMGSETFKRSVESYDRFLRHALRTILDEGIATGVFRPVRSEMAVIAIIGIINTFTRRIALGAPLSMADAVEQVMDSFVWGITVRGDARNEGIDVASAHSP